MNKRLLAFVLGAALGFPALADAGEINLVQNPGFESKGESAAPQIPDGYDLQGAAAWGRVGGEDEFTTQGILFPGDAKDGGSVSQTVRGIDPSKGRWLTFRFRGLAEDGFAVTDNALAMKIEFYSKNGANFLDGVTRPDLSRDRKRPPEPHRQRRLRQGRRRGLAQL